MNHRTDTALESPEKLIKNIQKLMDEVESVVAKSGDGGSHELGGTLEALQSRLADATEKARGIYHEASRKVRAGAHRADETIRSHPYESLAVALGVGVLLGALLRRRD